MGRARRSAGRGLADPHPIWTQKVQGRLLSVAQRAWPQDGDVALVLRGSVGLLIESSPGIYWFSAPS